MSRTAVLVIASLGWIRCSSYLQNVFMIFMIFMIFHDFSWIVMMCHFSWLVILPSSSLFFSLPLSSSLFFQLLPTSSNCIFMFLHFHEFLRFSMILNIFYEFLWFSMIFYDFLCQYFMKFAGPLAQRRVRSSTLRSSFRSTKYFVGGTRQRAFASSEPPRSLVGASLEPPCPFPPRT